MNTRMVMRGAASLFTPAIARARRPAAIQVSRGAGLLIGLMVSLLLWGALIAGAISLVAALRSPAPEQAPDLSVPVMTAPQAPAA